MIPLHLLPQREFKRLCSDLVIEEIDAGNYLFKRGDCDSAWIYLLKGRVVLENDGITMEQIQGGTEAARFPLAHQVPRKVSGRALTKLRYFRIDQQMMETMEQDQENTETKFQNDKTEKTDDWMGRLFKLSIFQSLPASNLQRILQRFEEVEVTAGSRIIEQGEEADCVYVMSAGRCMVTRKPRPNAKDIKLGEIQVGDLFGEDALISGLPRAVSVTMESDGSVHRLSKEDFIDLVVNPVLTKVSLELALCEVEQGSIWLDVRDPDAFQERHFEDSLNIPFFSLRMQLGTLDRKRRYIAVCDSGNLSSAATFLLLRYGFEASVLEGGLVGVPLKCLQGEVPENVNLEEGKGEFATNLQAPEGQQDAREQFAETKRQRPSHEYNDLSPLKISSDESEKLILLEAENKELATQVQLLQGEIEEMDIKQKEVHKRLQEHYERANQEKKQLEEQSIALKDRVQELEAVIRQYVEAAQFNDDEGGGEVQSLRAELAMVREQAETDVTAMRFKLEEVQRECERLQMELSQRAEERHVSSLPSHFQAVESQQLPLQNDSLGSNDTSSWNQGSAMVQGILWFLVGILASFSLLGIGLQTEYGKSWIFEWVQADGDSVSPSVNLKPTYGKTDEVMDKVKEEGEEAEDQRDPLLEGYSSGGAGEELFSDEGASEDLFAE